MKSSKPTGLPYLFLVLLTVFSFASTFVLANDVEESYTDLLVNRFDIRLSGFVSQSFVHSPHNKVPNQGLNGFETGLEFNVNLNKYSSIRGLINYDREKELEFNYLVWDTSYSLSEKFTIGARVGKLFMPYGFYNDTRGNPESRQGITPPIHIIWPNNVDFYDNSFFFKLVFAMTFIIPFVFFNLENAIIACIVWGLSLITAYSYHLAKKTKMNPGWVIFEHVFITILVIAAAYLVGRGIVFLVA